MNSGATGGRQGLRRPWLLLGPPPHLSPGFSWALAGPIRQYSGACLQPIPPQGPLSCSLRETQQPAGCLVALLLYKGWENFLWPVPLPQGPTLLPWPSGGAPVVLDPHQPWAFGGFQSRVFGGVFPLSLTFKTFPTSRQPFSVSHHIRIPLSQLPTEHISGRRHSSNMGPTCLPAAFPAPSSGDGGQPACLPGPGMVVWCPLPAEVLLKMHSIPPMPI